MSFNSRRIQLVSVVIREVMGVRLFLKIIMIRVWLMTFVLVVNFIPLSGDVFVNKLRNTDDSENTNQVHMRQYTMANDSYQSENSSETVFKNVLEYFETLSESNLAANEVRFQLLLMRKNTIPRQSNTQENLKTKKTHAIRKRFKKSVDGNFREAHEKEHFTTLKPTEEPFPVIYQQYGSCHPYHKYRAMSILVVDRCPVYTFNVKLISNCQGDDDNGRRRRNSCQIDIDRIPVQDAQGIVYRNVHCALCHDAKNITMWGLELNMDSIAELQVWDGNDKVVFMNELDTISNCTAKMFPWKTSDITKCTKSDYLSGNRIRSINTDSVPQKAVFPLSFQIIINFGINGKGHVFFSTTSQTESVSTQKCENNQIYDSKSGICRSVTCADGYQLIDSKCQPRYDTVVDTSYVAPTYLNQDEEISKLTLRLNVTVSELLIFQQDNIKGLLVKEISNLLEVRARRIANLTIEIVNGTTPGKMIELQAYVTAKPSDTDFSRKAKTRHMHTNTNNTTKTMTTHMNSMENETSFDTANLTDTDVPTTEVIELRPTEEYMPDTTKSNTTDEGEVPFSEVTTAPNTEAPDRPQQEQTDPEVPPGYKPLPKSNTVILEFFLLPTKNASDKDVSTEKAVDNINSLIDGKSFTFSLNGTSFQVDNFTNDNDALIMDNWCSRGSMDYSRHFKVESQYDPDSNSTVTGVYLNSSNTFYKPGQFDLYIMIQSTIGDTSNVSTTSYVFVCNMPTLQNKECGRIIVKTGEYKRFDNNSILYSDELLFLDEYQYVNDSYNAIIMCIPDSYQGEKSSLLLSGETCGPKFNGVIIAESYLSFILGIISMLAMVTVLITYCMFPTMRNLPGVNTMNLTLSLFLGEFFFLLSAVAVAIQSKWFCEALGVTLHYLFLVSFFWMNVMSYDLYRTFANNCIFTRIREKSKYFVRYFLYAWGSPAIIVLICACIDFTHLFKHLRIGYGGIDDLDSDNPSVEANITNGSSVVSNHGNVPTQSIGCWITEPVAALATFGLPMIIILASNTFMFIKTIICIRATSRLVQTRTRRSSISKNLGKSDVILYMRMSSVMGFTWIIGLASSIISAFTDTATETMCIVLHSIGIIFVVLNCSQGLFIFFAFVFNKRVFNLYKQKYRDWKFTRLDHKPYSSTSTISTLVK